MSRGLNAATPIFLQFFPFFCLPREQKNKTKPETTEHKKNKKKWSQPKTCLVHPRNRKIHYLLNYKRNTTNNMNTYVYIKYLCAFSSVHCDLGQGFCCVLFSNKQPLKLTKCIGCDKLSNYCISSHTTFMVFFSQK